MRVSFDYKLDLSKITNTAIALYVISLPIFSFREEYNIITNIFALFIVLFFFIRLCKHKFKIINHPFQLWFLLFIFSSLFSYVVAIDRSLVMVRLITVTLNFFVCISIVNLVDSKEHLEKIMKAFIIGSLLSIIYLYFYSEIFSGRRIGTELANVNMLALIYGISLIFSYYFFSIYRKWIYLIKMIIFSGFVFLTGSRKGLIAPLLFFMIYTFFINSNKVKGLLKSLMLSLFLGGIIVYVILNNAFLYNLIGYRFDYLFMYLTGGPTIDQSAQLREIMINVGFEAFLKRPLWGYGLGNSQLLLLKAGLGWDTYSHNNLIELLISVGLLGTSFFYLIYLSAMKKLIPFVKKNSRLASAFFSYNIVTLILGWGMVYYTLKVYYLILAMTVLVSVVHRPIQSNKR